MLGLVAAVVVLVVSIALYLKGTASRERLPPGPRGSIIAGNAFQVPRSEPWIWCAELQKQYGDVVYLSVFGRPMIILNSLEAINDLLVKRSSIYSDRPRAVMAGKIMGVGRTTPLAPYGDYWRAQRRLWHEHLGKKATLNYSDFISQESKASCFRLLDLALSAQQTTYSELRLLTVKLLLGMTYGMKVDSLEDDYVAVTDASSRDIIESFTPGRYLVDVMPFLNYLPSWFPGAGWKRFGLGVRNRLDKLAYEPYRRMQLNPNDGEMHSLTRGMIENPIADDETQIWVAGAVYGGGADTLHSSLNRLLVVLALFPEAQQRAQEEIERVVGDDRIPDSNDHDSLPYVAALIQEVLRWNIIGPLGIPRMTTEDDEYKGYRIPKGSIVLANYWNIAQDPKIYPNPDDFVPERFLRSDDPETHPQLDSRTFAYSVGRRFCPGQWFADSTLYHLAVTILATCIVSKPIDENGAEYEPHVKFSGLSLREMEPFSVRVRARSPQALDLLRASPVAELSG
ncbi:cytochrome P450 [Clavulina sp. PMI_390]|nr:cytochrome P450 [Clavulina sp. PMI_390]